MAMFKSHCAGRRQAAVLVAHCTTCPSMGRQMTSTGSKTHLALFLPSFHAPRFAHTHMNAGWASRIPVCGEKSLWFHLAGQDGMKGWHLLAGLPFGRTRLPPAHRALRKKGARTRLATTFSPNAASGIAFGLRALPLSSGVCFPLCLPATSGWPLTILAWVRLSPPWHRTTSSVLASGSRFLRCRSPALTAPHGRDMRSPLRRGALSPVTPRQRFTACWRRCTLLRLLANAPSPPAVPPARTE